MYLPLAELVDIEKGAGAHRRRAQKAEENLERIEEKLQNESFVSQGPGGGGQRRGEKAEKARALIAKLEESAPAMRS